MTVTFRDFSGISFYHFRAKGYIKKGRRMERLKRIFKMGLMGFSMGGFISGLLASNNNLVDKETSLPIFVR